jgi:Fic family protein
MDDEMWQLLSRVDRALGRLDGANDALPNPDLFVAMYVRKEAVLSSQIEGTQASLLDVLEWEATGEATAEGGDVSEIVNYVAAMNLGLEKLRTLPLSLRLIREIHDRLLKGVRGQERSPGQFRTTQNWVGPPGSTLRDAIYVPPPPHEVVRCMGDLETFIHSAPVMPDLIYVGLVHAQFETIHPFLDGNGRLGRLLITFLLCERGILKTPLLYVSHYFKRRREEYYARLQAARDDGDFEGWLKFFLTGVVEVAQEASQTARAIVALREEHTEAIRARFGLRTANALAVLERLYYRPVMDVRAVADMLSVSFTTASTLIEGLVEMGVLVEATGQVRNRRFRYAPYLALLGSEE